MMKLDQLATKENKSEAWSGEIIVLYLYRIPNKFNKHLVA